MSDYCPGPYRDPDSLPGANTTRPTIHSSREIDFATGRYTFAEDGSCNGMNDVAQRVMMLVARAEYFSPAAFIDDRSISAQEQEIRAALRPLWFGPSPLIADLRITVETPGNGTIKRRVEFTNLATTLKESVTLS